MTDPLSRPVAEADRWVADIATEMGGPSGPAQGALRAVLHAVRDTLPVDASIRLANRLPVLVRGMYYEGWPSEAVQEPFEARVAHGLLGSGVSDPKAATAAVFQALRRLLPDVTWPDLHVSPSPVSEDDLQRIQAAADRSALDGGNPVELKEFPGTPAMDDRILGSGSMFRDAVQHLAVWLKRWKDPERGFDELRQGLPALRNRLDREDALKLGLRLPAAARGFYFEDWNPDRLPRPQASVPEPVVRLLADEIADIDDLLPTHPRSRVRNARARSGRRR